MGRKARHKSRTGDGGAEVRLRKRQLKEAQQSHKEAELTFYDDPSENESNCERIESEDDELAGEEVLELGADENDDEEDDEDDVDMDGDDDNTFDADAERKKAIELEGKWGKKRKTFYSADTAEYELESDEEIAQDEEDAALELQRKQAEMMDDEDFGIDGPEADEDVEGEEEEDNNEIPVDDEDLVKAQLADIAQVADNGIGGVETIEQVPKDFSKMTKKDKLEIVNNSAPELLGLLAELESSTKELEEVVTPAVVKLRPVRRKSHQLQMGLRYLMTRQNLLLNYSTNISFYLLLRAEGKSVADHPVLMHLLLIKKQLNKLQSINEIMDGQLQDLLTKELPAAEREPKLNDGLNKFSATSTIKRGGNGANNLANHSRLQKKSIDVSIDELAEAERFYKQTEQDHAMLKKAKKELYTHENPSELLSSDEDNVSDGEGAKRGASYQIMKNKGLKAHKSKLNRNPRVKKRMQYRKAIIRRKGQVRDVRVGEASKYGGESTGIKANLSRSRKIRN
ncbi:Disrupter of silencing SAS10 [Plasmopara halstedii]|uniref:Disrupter of silencing SAS10 n=1 Tax=Plasmopara halstedii TaxID=4781 RepID=A0A0P1A9L8_PLAHL|nr:Disrupter of silencing SAS10 [Plasmopara halstedii]CEG37439.1 Disrupter of silencing SAS10 [Plasmopara halstedii]|eukprot:XP_024573808.1 Disrupter of silencing SAS10 [Plasmopara halstedii]